MIDWAKIADTVDNVLKLAEEFAPLLALEGPAGAAAGAAIAKGAELADHALTVATAVGGDIASGDLARIQAAADGLQKQNEILAAQVAAS